MKKLNVLMSAYACEPGKGSEPEVGWQWSLHMARFHDVTVITRANNRPAIEAELAQIPQPHPTFIYYDLPPLLIRLKRKGMPVALFYFLWQVGVRFVMQKRLHEFDIIHHVTFNAFRQPGFWWGCGKSVILGPLGGGQIAPWRLLPLFPCTFKWELLRSISVVLNSYSPLFLLSCGFASSILAANTDTALRIPFWWRKKTKILLETGIVPNAFDQKARRLGDSNLTKVIWVGRLIEYKAPVFALKAFALAYRENPALRLTFIGEGPQHPFLQRAINELGLESAVSLIGSVPKKLVQEILAEQDVLLFTSLRDTSGNVLLEAMSMGLPAICFGHHGAAEISSDKTAIRVVPSSREKSAQDIAEALLKLANEPELRQHMGQNARLRIFEEFSWEKSAEKMNQIYREAYSKVLHNQFKEMDIVLRQGRWVVLIGPDGVGKTSVANGIFAQVAGHFESLRYHHWIAPWTQPLRSEVPAGGGRFDAGSCRGGFIGSLLSLARLGRNVCRAWLGYLLRIRPHLRQRRLVLGDRYLFNYLLDPQSVRYGAAPGWVRLALRLVPKPDLVISLVADPEVIHARKDELTVAQIAERLARARQLRDLGFKLVEVSAQAPLPTVIENVAAAVVKELES